MALSDEWCTSSTSDKQCIQVRLSCGDKHKLWLCELRQIINIYDFLWDR